MTQSNYKSKVQIKIINMFNDVVEFYFTKNVFETDRFFPLK
jgi:hypothetical protein